MKIINTTASLLAILIIVISAGFAHAAGSECNITTPMISRDYNTLVIYVSCIADDTNGTVPVVEIKKSDLDNVPHDYVTMGYHLWEIWTIAGTPAPDAADVTIADRTGLQLFTEVGLITASGTKEGTLAKSKAVTANLILTQTNQATVDAQWITILKLVRVPTQ